MPKPQIPPTGRRPLPPTLPAVALLRFAVPLGVLALAACGGDGPRGDGRLADPDVIAARIAERARADYEGVRDFTVTGDDLTIHFIRTPPDSLVTFEYRAFTEDGQPAASPYVPPNAVQIALGLRGNARLIGTEGSGDEAAYVLAATDPGAVLGAAPGAAPPDSLTVVVNAETFRIRELRLTVPQTMLNPAAGSAAPPIRQRMRYGDFRGTGSLTLPFRTSYLLEGVEVSDEERMIQGGRVGIERQQALQLPPGERERAVRELDRLMRFYDTGVLEETFTVDEVRVNEGVPEGVFAPRGPPPAGP